MTRRLIPVALLALFLSSGVVSRAQEPGFTRTQDIIYSRKFGTALTLDVIKPAKQSGVGVLWMQSGGWVSSHDGINPATFKGFLDRGQTVFVIVHGCQPKFAIPEIIQDIDRATRFVRYHAKSYGVDPERLGIAGGSAGGHLSLMQGARGADGNPNAKDPVDRVHSRVQAVACFFPPTDFLNYGQPNTNALAVEGLKPFRAAFGAKNDTPEELAAVARADSPITFVTKAMPPSLIIHGDKDTLVPIQQAEVMIKRLEENQVKCRLVVREGKGHGWPELLQDVPILAEWIDQHVGK